MQMQIHSIHFDADTRLLEFVEHTVGKLNTFHDQIISCEVFLRVEKSDDRDNKVSEVKIHVPGADFFAKRKAPSFEAGIDEVVEAIRRQIRKQKTARLATA
jgi:putative sigma-54 modulation protein